MPSFTSSTKLLFPVLSALGIYCTWNLSEHNGFFEHVRQNGPLLPATTEHLKRVYTGSGPVDSLLTSLTISFWPIVDGQNPALSLQSLHFAGQYFALFMVLEVEARRLGSVWPMPFINALFGMAMQCAGFTNIGPIFFLLHAFLAPDLRSSDRTASTPSTNLYVPPRQLYLLPVSLTLSFIVPSALMMLPSPTITSFSLHQDLIASWQFFPLATFIVQSLLSLLANILLPAPKPYQSSSQRNAAVKAALDTILAYAFAIAATTHLATLTLGAASLLTPSIFQPSVLPQLHPLTFLFPPSLPPLPSSLASSGATSIITPVKGVAEGMHLFLQHDEIIGFAAALLWAVALWRDAQQRSASRPAHPVGISGWSVLAARTVLLTLVAGPGAAVVWLVWMRDGVVLRGERD